MNVKRVPFHYQLFYHAMIGLLGREPDAKSSVGGCYFFRYEPKDEIEAEKLLRCTRFLRDWLKLFDLIPLDSRCDYGRLVHPEVGQENKDYLEIIITLPEEDGTKSK